MKTKKTTWLVCLAGVLLHVMFASPAHGEEPREVFARANELFNQAEQRLATDVRGARELFAQAAVLYGSLVESGIDNHALHADRGTALLLSGDVGPAIASYLRGERIDPGDDAIRAGLAAARGKVETQVHRGTSRRVEDVLLFWRGFAPRTGIVGVGMVAWWACCAVVTLGVIRRPVHVWWLTASALVVAFCVTSLVVEQQVYVEAERAVLIHEADARLGPGVNAYAQAFGGPLSEGVEVEVLEHREDWTKIRLIDGRTAWVRAETLEIV